MIRVLMISTYGNADAGWGREPGMTVCHPRPENRAAQRERTWLPFMDGCAEGFTQSTIQQHSSIFTTHLYSQHLIMYSTTDAPKNAACGASSCNCGETPASASAECLAIPTPSLSPCLVILSPASPIKLRVGCGGQHAG
ncbi:hypothetical protein C2E23DRAFT_81808 [Lenzites betulinus]|nr:hypothetical protein C2E23DRAFT_81808 [Lenzites betulinus]